MRKIYLKKNDCFLNTSGKLISFFGCKGENQNFLSMYTKAYQCDIFFTPYGPNMKVIISHPYPRRVRITLVINMVVFHTCEIISSLYLIVDEKNEDHQKQITCLFDIFTIWKCTKDILTRPLTCNRLSRMHRQEMSTFKVTKLKTHL